MNDLRKEACGEVLESSLNHVRCALWKHTAMPRYGSLMVIEWGEYHVYGIVAASGRSPRDTTRTPYPYQKTEAELVRDHPHIFELIVSWCILCCICFSETAAENKKLILRAAAPPVPPTIHAFIRPATITEQAEVLGTPHIIHRLFAAASEQGIIPEELFIAFLTENKTTISLYQKALAELPLIMGTDYRRFKTLINRLSTLHPFIPHD
jgi:hypothetical protein